MVRKKGQAAGAVSVLLAIIAFFIIIFIVLLPPQERAALLEDSDSTSTPSTTTTSEKILLATTPGRIDYLAQQEIEHPLPVVNIRATTETQILAEKNLAQVKKGVFSEKAASFTFPLAAVEKTNNVLLTFTVKELEGHLIITLNGEEVYNAEPVLGAVKPITLSTRLLKAENEISFAVSSPGFAFWRTHGALLENIRIIGDVVDVSGQTSKNVFLVSETEKKNIESVRLKFQPSCAFGSVGPLQVHLNGAELYNAVPDCDVKMIPLELSPAALQQGSNEITFRTEKGTYLLSNVVVVSRLQAVTFPTYYFDVSLEEFETIDEEENRVRLTMNFVDTITSKEGRIVVNGNPRSFDSKEKSFVIDISADVVQGSNSIKIEPKKTVEIRELKVELVE